MYYIDNSDYLPLKTIQGIFWAHFRKNIGWDATLRVRAG
jgi:hypothetical protein